MQATNFGSFGTSSIVGLLFIMGFLMNYFKVQPTLGTIALVFAVILGIAYGIAGFAGIIKRVG